MGSFFVSLSAPSIVQLISSNRTVTSATSGWLNVQVAKRQIKRKHMNRKWEYIHASHMQKRKTFSVHYKVSLSRPNVVAVLVPSLHHLFITPTI
jgi:hypothetical protein